jgi:23S rRNA-/tRNA-specific pseudouridylate synthase
LLAGKPGSVIFLHAAALELRHPVTDEALRFSDPLPEAFEGLVSALRG